MTLKKDLILDYKDFTKVNIRNQKLQAEIQKYQHLDGYIKLGIVKTKIHFMVKDSWDRVVLLKKVRSKKGHFQF